MFCFFKKSKQDSESLYIHGPFALDKSVL